MDIIATILMFLPMVAALWFANLSHHKRIEGEVKSERLFKLLAYGLLFLLYGGLLVLGLLFQGFDLLIRSGLAGDAEAMLPVAGMSADALPRLALGFWAPSLLGLFLLTRSARRLVARFTAIDPSNPVHAVALSMTALILVNLLVTLGLGLGNLAEMLESSAVTGEVYDPLPGLWAQNITFLLMALVGVGLFARRTLRGTLNRFGDREADRGAGVVGGRGGSGDGAGDPAAGARGEQAGDRRGPGRGTADRAVDRSAHHVGAGHHDPGPGRGIG